MAYLRKIVNLGVVIRKNFYLHPGDTILVP